MNKVLLLINILIPILVLILSDFESAFYFSSLSVLIISILSFLILLPYKTLVLDKEYKYFLFVSIAVLFLFIINSYNDYDKISSIIILIIMPLLYINYNLLTKNVDENFFLGLFIVITLFSFILFISSNNFFDSNQRFLGFSKSPTTFSLYYIMLFSIILFLSKNMKINIILLVLVSFLLFLTKTRTSLVVLIFIILFRYNNNIQHFSKKYFQFIFIGIIFSLPLFNYLFDNYQDLFTIYSLRDDTASSSIARISFYINQLSLLQKNSLINWTIGNGIGSSQLFFSDFSNYYKAHNDFFILIYEFGLIFSFLFLFVFYKITKNSYSIVLIIIYLFSFYHNMFSNPYLISLLLLGLNIIKNKKYEYNRIS